jgi:hypothetical protein
VILAASGVGARLSDAARATRTKVRVVTRCDTVTACFLYHSRKIKNNIRRGEAALSLAKTPKGGSG